MAEATNNATMTVPATGGLAGLAPTSAIDISGKMILLTWIAFGIAAILLHRLAWKPILRALEKRERDIRVSLDDADRARKEAESSSARNRQAIGEAMDRARAINEEARVAAERTAARLEKEAREKARRLVDDASQEIAAAQRRALEELRREAGLLSVQISEKMLGEQLTPAQRSAYADRVVGNLQP